MHCLGAALSNQSASRTRELSKNPVAAGVRNVKTSASTVPHQQLPASEGYLTHFIQVGEGPSKNP